MNVNNVMGVIIAYKKIIIIKTGRRKKYYGRKRRF